jgi:choline kinase
MVHKANRHIAPTRRPIEEGRLSVIIPAAGIGKRMKSKGPKGLLQIHHGMSILELQIRTILKVYPHADIVIVGGFECYKIRDALWGNFAVRIVCNPQYETTNVTSSVAIGMEAVLPGPLLILHGDLVFNTNTITGLAGKHSSLLVVGDSLETTEVGVGQQDGVITTLSYALPSKWGQMAYLLGDELAIFRKAAWNSRISSQWFLYEALNYVIGKGGKFLAHQPTQAKIVEIDRYSDLMKAKLI